MAKAKAIATGVLGVALGLAGLALLTAGVYAAYRGDPTMVGVCIAGSILLLFSATIDRFESIKGLGVEAKTRQLDRKLQEADQAIDQLRQLAETLGVASVSAYSKLGRMGTSPTVDEAYAHAQKIRGVMASLGSKPEVINEMLRPFVGVMIFDLMEAVLDPVKKNIRENISRMQRDNRTLLQTDPEAYEKNLQLADEAHSFVERYGTLLYKQPVEDYPHEVLTRLARTPLLDSNVKEEAQGAILRLNGDILLLRHEGRLEQSEEWSRIVTTYRNRDAYGR